MESLSLSDISVEVDGDFTTTILPRVVNPQTLPINPAQPPQQGCGPREIIAEFALMKYSPWLRGFVRSGLGQKEKKLAIAAEIHDTVPHTISIACLHALRMSKIDIPLSAIGKRQSKLGTSLIREGIAM